MRWSRWPRSRTPLNWLVVLFVTSAAHFASYDVRRQPIATDVRFYLYFAARTADGAVPYVDYFEHKTPLAIYVGAVLHKTGELLGVDPLYAVRFGYLLLASATAAAMGAVLVRLFGGRPVPGIIGVLGFCGFGLLGAMPATGIIPKLFGMLGASLSALSVHRRHWFRAGIWAGIAGLDWQPCGGLAGLGILLAAVTGGRRIRQLLLAFLGLIAAFLPIVVYFGAIGHLGTFLDAIFITSLTKASADPISFLERCDRIALFLRQHTGGERWLLVAALPGIICLAARLLWRRHSETMRIRIALAVYHFGIIGFSLSDFQGVGDLFVLAGSLAFFGAVALAELYQWILRQLLRASRRVTPLAAQAWPIAVVAALVILVRPSFLRTGWRVNDPRLESTGAELAAQREVADRLFQVVRDRPILVVRQQELLYLGNGVNCAPFVTWNQGTYAYWRRQGEDLLDTFVRVARPYHPDAVIISPQWFPQLTQPPLRGWLSVEFRCLQVLADDESYQTLVFYRKALPIPTVPGVRFIDPTRIVWLPEDPGRQ